MNSPTFTVAVTYREPRAALDWLARAFGFEVTMAIEGPDDDPTMSHYEMAMGGRGRIMIGSEWADGDPPGIDRRGQHPEHARRAHR